MITDCQSHIVFQDTAEDDETLNLHVTALTTFQDGKLQDIHCQTLLDPQLVKLARVIQWHHYEWFMNRRSSLYNRNISNVYTWDT